MCIVGSRNFGFLGAVVVAMPGQAQGGRVANNLEKYRENGDCVRVWPRSKGIDERESTKRDRSLVQAAFNGPQQGGG